jgi:hypothetical protein
LQLQNDIKGYIEDFQKYVAKIKEIEAENNARAIKLCDVVAATTTGCAKYSDLLSRAKFPILIVEEAAEVFEAHIVTSLSENTQHMVLIGDH